MSNVNVEVWQEVWSIEAQKDASVAKIAVYLGLHGCQWEKCE